MVSWRYGVSEARQSAAVHVDRYADSLKDRLERYELLSYAISLQPVVRELLQAPGAHARAESANIYLTELNRQAKVTAIYVIDAAGIARAASNWNRPDSFVGAHYAFRPYFQAAMHGAVGRFYGIGTTVGEPGYFVSQPVYAQGRVIGAVAVKVNLEWFPKTTGNTTAPIVVGDEHGIVFLSSIPEWQYRALQRLPAEVQQTLEVTRQYDSRRITPLSLTTRQQLDANAEIVAISSAKDRLYLATHHRLGEPDWQLIYYAPLSQVVINARIAAVAAACALGLACALLFYWRQRRQRMREAAHSRLLLEAAYGELEQRVAERTTDLRIANRRLQAEVHERMRAEDELRAAQSELVQASKLAALGQMAAGITHELNQPLAALRSFSDNTRILLERGEEETVRENLQAIADLTDRMGKITGQLRLFAGKARPRDARASVRQAIDNALAVLRPRLQGIELVVEPIVEAASANNCLEVCCDALQLEQVLINLMANAAEAARNGPRAAAPRVVLGIEAEETAVRVRVRDNGAGIAADAMPHLFEPFFTTRQGGLGLGLAISLSIAQENGGQLNARNLEGKGAEFTLELRRATPYDGHDTNA